MEKPSLSAEEQDKLDQVRVLQEESGHDLPNLIYILNETIAQRIKTAQNPPKRDLSNSQESYDNVRYSLTP
jgi:hypothetical protein